MVSEGGLVVGGEDRGPDHLLRQVESVRYSNDLWFRHI